MLQNKINEIEFFDRFTQRSEYDVFTEYGYCTLITCFLTKIGNYLSPTMKIIDLGCGSGAFASRFIKRAKVEMWGVDISTNAIAVAKERGENIQYAVGDISQLGFKDESFDVVIFSGVLHHFPDTQPCLKEAYRILKKGGVLLSYDPHINNPLMWLYRHPSSPFFSNVGRTDNERLLSRQEMQRDLELAGFLNIECKPISGITFKYVESNVGRLLLPIYNAIEYLLGKLSVEKIIGSFLICFAKK